MAARGLGCVVFFGSEEPLDISPLMALCGAGEAVRFAVRLERRPSLPLLADLATILQGVAQIIAQRCG